MGVCQTLVVQASLGGFDRPKGNYPNYHLFTDNNFPPRKGLLPRMQAKIPKCFAWQLLPGYEFYLWLDGNLTLHSDGLKYLLEQIDGYDLVVLRHPRMPNIRQEIRYLRKGLRQQSRYLVARYDGEFLPEQTKLIDSDKSFTDDLMVIGGIFLYRNTPQIQEMMKEWWYHITRYNIQDQISFAYVIKKFGIKVKVLNHVYDKWEYLTVNRHAKRYV